MKFFLKLVGISAFLVFLSNAVLAETNLRTRYLALMKQCLLDDVYGCLDLNGKPMPASAVDEGNVWPLRAHTMIGRKRLNNIQELFENVQREGIEGDLMECGVWRGGATIFMRSLLEAYDIKNRTVWVADSFEGLPKPNAAVYPVDMNDKHNTFTFLAVGLEEVQNNFKAYGLLDNQVKFIKGFFKDSLPRCGVKKIAILRLDADMYEGTIQALEMLYDKVASGGYVIIDDYALTGAHRAVNDFRRKNNIKASLVRIDWTGVYWKK